MLYIKGVCHYCNTFISEMENQNNNDCYGIKIVCRYNVDILMLMNILLRKNVERVVADLHFHRVQILVCISIIRITFCSFSVSV